MRCTSISTILCLVLAAASAGLTFASQSTDTRENDIYKAPTSPPSDRVKVEKITEYAPPPLPEQVVQPMPPTYRIAERSQQVPISRDHFTRAREAIAGGLDYLKSAQSDEQGMWLPDTSAAPTDQPDRQSSITIAVTAMAIKAFAQFDASKLDTPTMREAINTIIAQHNRPEDSLAIYTTSAVVSALATFDKDEFRDEIREGIGALEANQWTQVDGISARQDWFGGAGYGSHGRPDLSNTQMMLEALYDAGVSPDEPAVQRALAFVSRAQNLEATNSAPWAGNDGGFIYTPANGGESMGSEAAGEGRYGEKIPEGQPRSLRSYGSMTYAGFKSLLYAGLSKDDVRVRAAFDWIRTHWTFDNNPGLGQQGLYYYYHAMSRALRVAQQDTIIDSNGTPHNWREEMIDAIIKRQREDGSWKNEAERWMEGEPVMATIDAVLALEETIKPVLPTE